MPMLTISNIFKTNDKGKILKAAKEHITYIETKIRMTAHSPSDTVQKKIVEQHPLKD